MQDQIIAITGASSGIGAEIAVALARRGARLVLYGRNREGLQATAQRVASATASTSGSNAREASTSAGTASTSGSSTGRASTVRSGESAGRTASNASPPAESQGSAAGAADSGTERCRTYVLDVTSDEQVQLAVEQAIADFGRIDVWINNAGYGVFKRLDEAPLSDFTGMMDVNYMGTVRCTKAVLPHMRRAGRGQLVNVASIAGKIGSAKSTAYAASKHAVLGFTNSLRQELHGTGIVVTAVNPGPIDTPFFQQADPSGEYVNNIKAFMLKPERVADAVVNAIDRRRTHVDLPWTMGFGAKLFALFPALFERIAVKLLNKK
ncbi:SDR family NAD(P)-dependent oxidoreductase [Paenibacillus koleovorans]|uniref:SDR family NAD(P)-dependent oxidoreductase n=1 Tax=Paenibacillus koleovorans TaxID=121608 RepID=UPI000FD84D28|nr:SDR family oxidoreductase [Paenibacillus koleovorans]